MGLSNRTVQAIEDQVQASLKEVESRLVERLHLKQAMLDQQASRIVELEKMLELRAQSTTDLAAELERLTRVKLMEAMIKVDERVEEFVQRQFGNILRQALGLETAYGRIDIRADSVLGRAIGDLTRERAEAYVKEALEKTPVTDELFESVSRQIKSKLAERFQGLVHETVLKEIDAYAAQKAAAVVTTFREENPL